MTCTCTTGFDETGISEQPPKECSECKTDKAVGAAMRKTTALAELVEKLKKLEGQYEELFQHRYERETGKALLELPGYFHIYRGTAGWGVEDQDDESMYIGASPKEAIDKASEARSAVIEAHKKVEVK